MRWRVLIPLLLALLGPLGSAAPARAAAAPTVAAITKQLATRPSYVDPTVKPRVTPVALQRMAVEHPTVRFVVLQALPRGVTTGPAAVRAILTELDGPVTVVVWRGGKLFAASSSAPAARVADAVRRALRGTDKRPVPTLDRFATILERPPVAATTPAADDSGRPIWHWLLGAAALVLLGLAALRLRQRSRDARARRRGGSLSTAKDFHGARLDALSASHAGLVREVADRPSDTALAEHFELARGKITALRRSLPTLHSPRELRTCAGELDEVQWHLEAAQAQVAGSPVPEAPLRDRPGLCFFTHEHGLARHDIDVDRPNGVTVTVRVCDANFEALARGEAPFVSQVHVGNRLLPWPAAPTWYGAAGWTPADLPGLEVGGREIWGRDTPARSSAPAAGPENADATTADATGDGAALDRSASGAAAGSSSEPDARLESTTRDGTDAPDPTAAESGREPLEPSQMWEELDESPPAGLSREAAAKAIGPLDESDPEAADEAEGLRRGEETVGFDPLAEPLDDRDDDGSAEGRTRRTDG